MGIVFSDFGRAKLASGITAATATPFTMNLDDGTKFKAYGAGEYEYLVLKDASLNREIIQVNARTGNAFTVIQRAIGGTTARDWSIGDLCEAALTAEGLTGLLVDTVLTGSTKVSKIYVGGNIPASSSIMQLVSASNTSLDHGFPAIPVTSQSMAGLAGWGYTVGTTWQVAGGINIRAAENWTSTAAGSRVQVHAIANGTLTLREVFSFDHDGGITLPVLGARIRGDFSNTTLASSIAFQTSTANSRTFISAIPNGTSQNAAFISYNTSSFTNTGRAGVSIDGSFAYIFSSSVGSGTPLPLKVLVALTTAAQFDTAGQWGIGGANYGTTGQAIVSGGPSAPPAWTTIDKTFVGLGAVENTSDANKPVSTAQAAADTAVANTAASALSTHAGGTAVHAIAGVTGLQTALNAKAPIASPAFTGTVTCTGDIVAFA